MRIGTFLHRPNRLKKKTEKEMGEKEKKPYHGRRRSSQRASVATEGM